MFYRWLNERHKAGVSLSRVALEMFDDKMMATLVDADSHEGVVREQSGTGYKDPGFMLPTFCCGGTPVQGLAYEMHAYLGNLKSTNGIPFLHVFGCVVPLRSTVPFITSMYSCTKRRKRVWSDASCKVRV